MAFTGDLEHLHITDIIQLLHTARKSGVFSVKGGKGESRIVFSNGHIADASHLDNRINIGPVLVKMNAITLDELNQAFGVMKDAGKNRKPLLATLIETGTVKREDALRGLRKLIEVTIVDLMSWTKGDFTVDTDAIQTSSAGGHPGNDSEQELTVDAQMVLMDALRVFDERERDRASGKNVPSYEDFYGDVLVAEMPGEIIATEVPAATVTADDLGLADLDRLEKKIPRPVAEMEVFDPLVIHRRKIREILTGFSSEEQEEVVSFLKQSLDQKAAPDAAGKQAGKAIVVFTRDRLLTHVVMSLSKDQGVLAFVTDSEKDIDGIVLQCMSSMRTPVVVFDSPVKSEDGFSREIIIRIRSGLMKSYSSVPVIQLASAQDSDFFLQSYNAGVRAVLPKPVPDVRRESYIKDTIEFFGVFISYIKGFPCGYDEAGNTVKKVRDGLVSFRGLANPSDAALVVLAGVSEMLERAVTLLVRPSELVGERAIGLGADKSLGPVAADRFRISLSKPSIFTDALEKGRIYFGESGDEALREFFKLIGKPLSPAVVLLPLKIERKVVALVYGDFGQKQAGAIGLDMLEILAEQASLVLESAFFRRQAAKVQKS